MAHWTTEIELQRVLRLAFLYGALEEHDGRAFVPGAPRKPVCGHGVIYGMVQRGWLKQNGHSRFEITDQGRQAEEGYNRFH